MNEKRLHHEGERLQQTKNLLQHRFIQQFQHQKTKNPQNSRRQELPACASAAAVEAPLVPARPTAVATGVVGRWIKGGADPPRLVGGWIKGGQTRAACRQVAEQGRGRPSDLLLQHLKAPSATLKINVCIITNMLKVLIIIHRKMR